MARYRGEHLLQRFVVLEELDELRGRRIYEHEVLASPAVLDAAIRAFHLEDRAGAYQRQSASSDSTTPPIAVDPYLVDAIRASMTDGGTVVIEHVHPGDRTFDEEEHLTVFYVDNILADASMPFLFVYSRATTAVTMYLPRVPMEARFEPMDEIGNWEGCYEYLISLRHIRREHHYLWNVEESDRDAERFALGFELAVRGLQTVTTSEGEDEDEDGMVSWNATLSMR
ncbi:hypothetical protein B0A50_03220 [Salinomyces thailandicus]|uniref:Uncharacterized protein n=1 Tax=Salinomyces thailandicus TaxID=706561 RepID=A0A4U0U5Y9_9PEZI|nr:hypothetical protein B0A50_03220 [Salinomyces thailandica]